jgi:hypothetical protein
MSVLLQLQFNIHQDERLVFDEKDFQLHTPPKRTQVAAAR